jgi:cytochrome b561
MMAPGETDANARTSTWLDDRAGYGIISRTLHWLMAALFAWQFTSALCNQFAPETALRNFFWSMHFNFGIILWCLVFLRGTWGLINLSRRPPYEGPRVQRWAAGIVHFALYVLMVTIPSLGLLRAYGSERGMRFFGQQIFNPRGQEIEPLVALGNALHGELGYTLLVLVAGHVTMALWHGFVRRDGILQRMTRGDERVVSMV